MKILAVSDEEIPSIYGPGIKSRFSDAHIVIAAGDLNYSYQEYIISMLDVPLYYVRGNHTPVVETTSGGTRSEPWGAVDLHRCIHRERHSGLLLAGVEGCLRYHKGAYQYSQFEMWLHVLRLVPGLLVNRVRYGRYLDIFVTHAPAWGLGDDDDRPHWGIRAFRWLDRVFKPALHLHGHVRLLHSEIPRCIQFHDTRIINVHGYYEIQLPLPHKTK
jgi:uncharacterized protein